MGEEGVVAVGVESHDAGRHVAAGIEKNVMPGEAVGVQEVRAGNADDGDGVVVERRGPAGANFGDITEGLMGQKRGFGEERGSLKDAGLERRDGFAESLEAGAGDKEDDGDDGQDDVGENYEDDNYRA